MVRVASLPESGAERRGLKEHSGAIWDPVREALGFVTSVHIVDLMR
jgi:hypothetical protein